MQTPSYKSPIYVIICEKSTENLILEVGVFCEPKQGSVANNYTKLLMYMIWEYVHSPLKINTARHRTNTHPSKWLIYLYSHILYLKNIEAAQADKITEKRSRCHSYALWTIDKDVEAHVNSICRDVSVRNDSAGEILTVGSFPQSVGRHGERKMSTSVELRINCGR
jgi:hypothetical protein